MRRAYALTTGGVLVLLGAGCTSLASSTTAIENAILFQPQAYPKGEWTTDPGVEDVWFESADGTRLHGWFARAEHPRAVVLYTHGNGGNITNLHEVLSLFHDRMNTSVLVFDYRGYGKSEGTPTEVGLLDDARAARGWLVKNCGVRASDIVLVGHSLGGGVAVDLAAADGARGLILESTFTSLPDVATSHFALLPARTLMHARLDSVSKIRRYRGPLLQVHGDADRVVPYSIGRRLFEAANEPKQFISVPSGGHNDPPTPEYTAALERFLGSLQPTDRTKLPLAR